MNQYQRMINNQAHRGNPDGYSVAYAAVRDRFNLRAMQRDSLDGSSVYVDVMEAALVQDWLKVESLLRADGIIA